MYVIQIQLFVLALILLPRESLLFKVEVEVQRDIFCEPSVQSEYYQY